MRILIFIVFISLNTKGLTTVPSSCLTLIDSLESEIIFNEYLTDESKTQKTIDLIEYAKEIDFKKKDLFLSYAEINLANIREINDFILYNYIELTENCDISNPAERRVFLGSIFQISGIYRHNNATELSIQFIQKGINLIEKENLTDYPWIQDYYNHIGVAFLSKGDYENCKIALNEALLYGKKKAPLQDAMVEYNLSFLNFEINNLDAAIDHQEKACATLKQINKLNSFPELYARYGNSLGSLAFFYYKNQDIEVANSTALRAKKVYEKIETYDSGRYPHLYTLINISIDKKLNEQIHQLLLDIEFVANKIETGKFNFLLLLSDSYARMENTSKENSYLNSAYFQFRVENDSIIFNLQKYNSKLQSEMLMHEKKRFISEKEELNRQSIFNTVIISVISLFLITIIYTFYIKTRNKKDILEKEKKISKIELEKTEIKSKLTESELNEKRLIANRLASHIKLKQHTETVFLQKIKELKRSNPQNIETEISQLQIKMINLIGIDQNYEQRLEVNDLNQEFRAKLKKNHPDLNDKEMQFCTYLILNLTTKEIGSITNQSDGAIRVYKNRLKNKLVGKQKMEILEYLQSI